MHPVFMQGEMHEALLQLQQHQGRCVCGARSVHACSTACAVSWQSALQPETRGECVQCELTVGAASCAMSVCHARSLWEA